MINKKVDIDLDGDNKPDLQLDLKTLIMAIGGVVSLVLTYTTLKEQIAINATEIEVAKKLPPTQSHDLIDQKILFLEEHIKAESLKLEKLEDKIYKR